MFKSGKISFILLIIISFAFLHFFYGEVLLNPDKFLLNQNGDAIKNYFTYASHLKENTLIHSGIMNYPYGESFMYLDCQPLLIVILKGLSVPFPSILNYSVGIINFLMLFSIAFSALFLYLLFINLNVNKWLSVAGAFAISVLAPQILRIYGHLALSYSFLIPLTLYLFLKFFQSHHKIKWSVILFVNNISWFFIHAYLGMIITAFLLLFFLFDFIFFNRKDLKNPLHWLYIALHTFLPVIIFWLFITLTDTHYGRTNNPYGFLLYTSSFYSVFLPNHPPLRQYFEFIQIDRFWEGWAYIGAGSVFTILFFVIKGIVRLVRRKPRIDQLNKHRFILPAICSSVFLLMLSMGYPFKWNLEVILDWIPAIKSFRASGRFAWVFYYIITISSIYYWSLITELNKKNLIYWLIAFMIPASYFWEGISYHKELKGHLKKNTNLFDRRQLTGPLFRGLEIADKDKYQAIIPLPYYHIGSENYTKSGTNKIYQISMVLSFHSRIPLMANYSTNTSIPESKKLIQILSPGYYQPKLIQADLNSSKPFLIVHSNEKLSEYEQAILERGQKVFSENEFTMYSITKEDLFRNTASEELSAFEKIRGQLVEFNSFSISLPDSVESATYSNSFISYDSFDNNSQELTFRGNGAYSGDMNSYNRLSSIDISKLQKNRSYIVSFWMYNEGNDHGQDVLNSSTFIEVLFPEQKGTWISVTNPARSVVINSSWSLVEFEFKLPENASQLTVMLRGDHSSRKKVHIDDLLIRAKDTDVYKVIREENGKVKELFRNNHRIVL